MTKSMYATHMMSYGASAPCANAASSCAQAASMRSANIALILDAMIMASIIICLICGLIAAAFLTPVHSGWLPAGSGTAGSPVGMRKCEYARNAKVRVTVSIQ